MLQVTSLTKTFRLARKKRDSAERADPRERGRWFHALDGVDIGVQRGQVLGLQSEPVGNACKAMARAYTAQGECEQARAFYERAAAAFAAALGPAHGSTVGARRKAAEMA